MSKLSETPLGSEWLAGFGNADDRATATLIIDAVLLVSRNDLTRNIRTIIETLLIDRADPVRPVALFAERAVPKVKGVVQPLFLNSASGKATGSGVPPILVTPNDQEVGSEGIVANIITEFARNRSQDVLSHPGPDRMRAKKVCDIIIVTDFIGSGRRVWEMLESFRAVATLRSWKSYKLINFHVIAYAATDQGLTIVNSNRLKPKTTTIVGCPTIRNMFSGSQLSRVLALCRLYPPRHKMPMGFQEGGVLIAFAHGMPNNAPAILHSRVNGWTPLFPGRSTAGAELAFSFDSAESMAERAERLLRIQNANAYLSDFVDSRWIATMMVLASINAGARSISSLSAQAGLPLTRIGEILSYTRIARWTTDRNTLTTLGRQELARLRRRRRHTLALHNSSSPLYYPTQLRAR